MRIVIDVEGDLSDVEDYLKCIKISRKLIKSIEFERSDLYEDN